jgi:tetratricopeptide (TPR) repeat protein
MKLRHVLAAAALGAAPIALTPARALAQSAAEHIAAGDKEHLSNPTAALKHYEAALAASPRDYAALWKASVAAVDAGEANQDPARRKELYKQGETYARTALEVNPRDAEGHFALARALGRTAQSLGSRDRVKYAGEVRKHAMEALQLNPRHAGALHVMGVWNAEVMRLNGVSRFMAKNFLGGQVFGSASWKNATSYMEQAVQVEPARLIHRIDLAEIYADVGDKAKAREQIDYILKAPTSEANDARYKRQAEELARRVK